LTILNTLTGCSGSDSIFIKKFISPDLSYTKEDIKCNGDSTGKIELKLIGGTHPVVFFYSDPRIATHSSQLASGVYKVTVMDSINCKSEVEIQISEPEKIFITPMVTHTAGNSGKITLNVSGGTPPYSYKWFKDNIEFGVTKDLEDLSPGIYEVMIIDSVGCAYKSDLIVVNNTTSTDQLSLEKTYLYPTVATENLTIHFDKIPMETCTIDVIGLSGQLVFRKEVLLNNKEYSISLKGYSAGLYKLMIRNKSELKELQFEVVK